MKCTSPKPKATGQKRKEVHIQVVGLYIIQSISKTGLCALSNQKGVTLKKKYNVSLLKPFYSNERPNTDVDEDPEPKPEAVKIVEDPEPEPEVVKIYEDSIQKHRGIFLINCPLR